MKLTFRVNGSETLIVQKNDIIYTKEEIDKEKDNKRNVSVFLKTGLWVYFSISIGEMKNAFTYLVYDNENYVLNPDWVKLKDKEGNLLKILKKGDFE